MVTQAPVDHLFSTAGSVWRRLPRYVALAPLLVRRRVLVLGCGSGAGATWLSAGRARRVVVDRDPEAIEEAARRLGRPGLEFLPWDGAALPFDDGVFDAVAALRAEDPCELIDEVRRVLAPGGVFAAALDNPARRGLPVAGEEGVAPGEGSGHGLFLVLRRHFRQVRLIGQIPVVGFLFADLAVPDGARPALLLEEELLDGELDETDAWLAICSDDEDGGTPPDPALVRLPFDQLADHLLEEASELQGRLRELADGSGQAEEFQARLDELEVALRAAQTELEEAEGERVGEPEAAAAPPDTARPEPGGLVDELEAELQEARAARQRAEEDLRAQRRELARLTAEVAARDRRVETLERRLLAGDADAGT